MPKTSNDLQTKLHAIHQKGYPAYKELRGTYQFPNYLLYIDHVQGDPFASPSSISAVSYTHLTLPTILLV